MLKVCVGVFESRAEWGGWVKNLGIQAPLPFYQVSHREGGRGQNIWKHADVILNVGEKNNDYVEMKIPNNLVSEFEMLSRSNSEHWIETGGILGGIKEKGLFKITHLLISEQNGSHDRWEVNAYM